MAPGADPGRIRFGIEGAQNIRINPRGDLVLHTGNGNLVQHAPLVYQEINGRHADGSFISKYEELKDDGSTTCGSWIHAGIYADGVNQTARKKPV